VQPVCEDDPKLSFHRAWQFGETVNGMA